MKWVTRGGAPRRGCDLGAALAGVIIPLQPDELANGIIGLAVIPTCKKVV